MTNNGKDRYLISRIIEVLEKEKLYTDQSLTIEQLARAVNSNRTYIWKAVSELGINYNSFINNFRAQYAIDMIRQKSLLGVPLEDIAVMAGFASVRKMNSYIKKSVGETAHAYRQRLYGQTPTASQP